MVFVMISLSSGSEDNTNSYFVAFLIGVHEKLTAVCSPGKDRQRVSIM